MYLLLIAMETSVYPKMINLILHIHTIQVKDSYTTLTVMFFLIESRELQLVKGCWELFWPLAEWQIPAPLTKYHSQESLGGSHDCKSPASCSRQVHISLWTLAYQKDAFPIPLLLFLLELQTWWELSMVNNTVHGQLHLYTNATKAKEIPCHLGEGGNRGYRILKQLSSKILRPPAGEICKELRFKLAGP